MASTMRSATTLLYLYAPTADSGSSRNVSSLAFPSSRDFRVATLLV